ncbi:MAG TPA: hypothetical protein VJP76_06065 [Candidatus Tumulicola sp.]|nr:hypothetical protein [Candidatus Tumulicola sp.]
MRFSIPSALAASAAAGALLAGCSNATSAPTQSTGFTPAALQRAAVSPYGHLKPHGRRPAWMKAAPDAAYTGLAVAQFGSNSVLKFKKKTNRKNRPPIVCAPATSTNGIRVDRGGNLWVPNGIADSTTKYAPNCGAALLTIPDPTGEPADVALDSSGNVYILNINNLSGPPTVQVYAPDGSQIGTLSDPSFNVLFGVGVDRHDNVFVSNLTSSNVGNVVEFAGGKMPGTQLSGISLGLPGTPAFDSNGNLIISDWLAGTLDVFAPPYASPPSTSPLMGASIWCPLGYHQKRVYCGDAENGSIDVYAYPGGAYLYSYTAALSPSALVTGVSPYPPMK